MGYDWNGGWLVFSSCRGYFDDVGAADHAEKSDGNGN